MNHVSGHHSPDVGGALAADNLAMSTTAFIDTIIGPAAEAPGDDSPALTLRYAVPSDAEALDRLAQLDSQRAPRGAVLVAEVGGELWAAVSLDDRHPVADPFRPTRELVALLVERARQLRRSRRSRRFAAPRAWAGAGRDRPAMS
jgi:hypothetical protein